jgi:CDGSH-type Zn-finger protein
MTDQTGFRIKIKPNGSYRVTGGVPLIRRALSKSVYGEPLDWDFVGVDDQAVPVGEQYSLCRCGRSQNMPFCDDSHHQEPAFDGTLTADRGPSAERRETYQGSGVIMSDDGSLCANTGFCGTRLINVWEMIERTADPEVRLRLLRMVANCPSGRLEAKLADGTPVEPEFNPSIAVVPDGPLWVRGGIPIEDADGFVYEVRNRVTLCRCGKSGNMPFCDGTHDEIGFKAP